jgi:hypothetical protein
MYRVASYSQMPNVDVSIPISMNEWFQTRNYDTVLKKSINFCNSMRWKLLNVLVMMILRILSTNSNDFVISHTLSISPKPRDCI